VADLELLNMIREVWERYPFYGYRRITKELRFEGLNVNRKRVQRLMKEGCIQAIYPGPNTSKRNKQHATYSYLLRDIVINRVNQAWMVDITYLKLPKGFVYLVAIIDVYSRFVVGWELTNSLETDACVEALNQGLQYATPEIINSDQGCQFTSEKWVECLNEQEIKISMTGKGRCLDNIHIERFWRSLKYEQFYLNDYDTIKELRSGIKDYIEFYNHKRWHQSLGYKRPAEVYFGSKENEAVEMCTSPSDQPAPFGTYGQVMDNAVASPTT